MKLLLWKTSIVIRAFLIQQKHLIWQIFINYCQFIDLEINSEYFFYSFQKHTE